MTINIPQIVPVPTKKPTDPWVVGKKAGWKITDASTLTKDLTVTVDVVIIGTGAGGGITAEMLTAAGLKVALIEEGPLKSSTDFNMKESEAYPAMYQEALGRKTLDGGMGILQGRTVGGGTTINWATSIRTPAEVLEHWQRRFGLADLTVARMDPWFRAVEARLGIQPWKGVPNANNQILSNGLSKLGYSWGILSPNVRGCADLGYCGLGCPINAKQSMLVTTLPTALALGASLYTRLRAQNYVFNSTKDKVESLVCDALDAPGLRPSGRKVIFKAKHFVQAASAINGPGLLLRSSAPDPFGTLGKRTFLHPSATVSGIFPNQVKAFQGLPQSVYSDHFLYQNPITGPLGFKLEVAPLHPVLVASSVSAIGEGHADVMRNYANYGTVISFVRDGFHPDAPGGSIQLRSDGSPILDYPLTPTIFEGLRRALKVQTDVVFAAGATRVFTGHQASKPGGYTSREELQAAIDGFPLTSGLLRMQSAHQMGGCGMSADPAMGVVNGDGRHHQVKNLSVHDASLFPTSLGANPQETIFALSARMTTKLALDIFKKNCALTSV